jgi:hypothetical protein
VKKTGEPIVGEQPILCMLDRNYESLEFMDFLEQKEIKYLIRLRRGNYEAEKTRMQSADEEVEQVYTRARVGHLREKSPERMRELAQQKSKRVRIIKTKIASGEASAFMMNLKEGTTADIVKLYWKRWAIEQKYGSAIHIRKRAVYLYIWWGMPGESGN